MSRAKPEGEGVWIDNRTCACLVKGMSLQHLGKVHDLLIKHDFEFNKSGFGFLEAICREIDERRDTAWSADPHARPDDVHRACDSRCVRKKGDSV